MATSGAKVPMESVASVTDLVVKRVSVGKSLRRTRERKRITLAEVAESTRILTRYLTALEEDAGPDAYPAPVYARAFLREYARFLRLDPEPLVAEWKAAHEQPEQHVIEMIPVPHERRRLTPWGVGVICAAVFLAMLLAPIGGTDKPASSPHARTSAPQTVVAVPPAAPSTNRAPAAVPARAIAMTIRTDGGRCWVQATVDGKLALQKTMSDGSSEFLRGARTIELVLGNADVVTIVVNGKTIDSLGGKGAVQHLKVFLDHGTVRVTPASA
jgi:cytoskeleton protein RodZ